VSRVSLIPEGLSAFRLSEYEPATQLGHLESPEIPPTTTALVSPTSQAFSMARKSHPIPDLDFRDHVAADSGEGGDPTLWPLSRSLPEFGIPCASFGARRSRAVVRAWILQQGSKPSPCGPIDCQRIWRFSRRFFGDPCPAWSREIHGRRSLLDCFQPGTARC